MTLPEHCAAGISKNTEINPIAALLASGIARSAIQAHHDGLLELEGRCVISTDQRHFLARVLALMP